MGIWTTDVAVRDTVAKVSCGLVPRSFSHIPHQRGWWGVKKWYVLWSRTKALLSGRNEQLDSQTSSQTDNKDDGGGIARKSSSHGNRHPAKPSRSWELRDTHKRRTLAARQQESISDPLGKAEVGVLGLAWGVCPARHLPRSPRSNMYIRLWGTQATEGAEEPEETSELTSELRFAWRLSFSAFSVLFLSASHPDPPQLFPRRGGARASVPTKTFRDECSPKPLLITHFRSLCGVLGWSKTAQ